MWQGRVEKERRSMRIPDRHSAVAAAVAAVLCLLPALGCDDSGSKKKGARGTYETTKRDRPSGYIETTVRAKQFIKQQKCKARLARLHRALKRYAATNDTFPPSLQELVDSGFASQAQLRCAGRARGKYAYIAGQNESMDGGNVLVYEPQRSHNGQCHVLRLNGTVQLLPPEDMEAAVEATRRRPRRR